jgi:peptidoglycan L-alanyl-D-glutamate endopeptidase CwlK
MPKFGTSSKAKLATCHPDLQRLFNEVIEYYDCTVICGNRSKEEQDKAFNEGRSKVQWPNSKHNGSPSMAADVVPYPIDWEDTRRFYMFVGIVRGIAAMLNIKIRCGADWDGDMEVKDQNFHDLPHFELVE